MYTPRQSSSSLTRAQTTTNNGTGIRVVIQPSQSSYFAGEPFTCTITFTNTHSPISVTQARFASTSFTPGHKRAAHSVSSAPLSRPPTSPGPPNSAQQFAHSQNKDVDPEERLHRRGLIGKPAIAATAALEKKRRMSARSLSVDITPQDLIKRLVDSSSPTVHLSQSEQISPISPRISSSLMHEHVDVLPPSHPHARKHSVVSDDIAVFPSPSTSSRIYAQSPSTPLSALSFQLSLDPITENSNNLPTPQTTTFSSPFGSSSSLIQPPPPPQPQGKRPGHSRRPSLGLGLALPRAQTTNVRAQSVGGSAQPPYATASTTFSPPSAELLLYAYAQLTGTLTLDSAAATTSAEFAELRAALHKQTVVGGGSLDIGLSHRQRSNSRSGLFGFLSSASPTDPAVNSPGMFSSFLKGNTPSAGSAADDADDGLPTLETQPSMLAVDLSLAAGESRSYSYLLTLPPHLPPTFKGRELRFSYQLVVGVCRATGPVPISPASPSLSSVFAPSALSSQGPFGDRERRQSRIMRVPIRVYNHVAVGHGPIPYDLMWPVARRRAPAATGRVGEVRGDANIAKRLKPAGSLAGVQAYAQRLVAGEAELESGIDEAGEDGSLSGCAEAVEINTRNPRKVSYDVSKGGEKVAVLTFVKSAYRLGETVLGVVELNEPQCRSKVLKLSAILEAHESLPWANDSTRRVHAEHHSSLVSDMRRVAFALDIPSDASPAFKITNDPSESVGGLDWRVKLCLIVAIAAGAGSPNGKGKGRAVEVRNLVRDGTAGEWGTPWRASESIAPMERLRAKVPDLPPGKTSGSWTSLFSSLASGTFHDTGSDSGLEDDGEWAEMQTETVECMVPLRVYPGNTAFRAVEVAFEV